LGILEVDGAVGIEVPFSLGPGGLGGVAEQVLVNIVPGISYTMRTGLRMPVSVAAPAPTVDSETTSTLTLWSDPVTCMIPSITISAVVSVTSESKAAAAGKLELQVEGMAQFILFSSYTVGLQV
jgi:hypothetical protein